MSLKGRHRYQHDADAMWDTPKNQEILGLIDVLTQDEA